MYERLEALMRERGLRAADVAKGTGIGRSTFSDWKNGRSRPKREKLKKIAAYLGTTVDYLEGTEEPAEHEGVLIGFGGEQEPIRLTESEYETIRAVLRTIRGE